MLNNDESLSGYAQVLCQRLSDKLNALTFQNKDEVLVAFHAIAMGLYAEGLVKLGIEQADKGCEVEKDG